MLKQLCCYSQVLKLVQQTLQVFPGALLLPLGVEYHFEVKGRRPNLNEQNFFSDKGKHTQETLMCIILN